MWTLRGCAVALGILCAGPVWACALAPTASANVPLETHGAYDLTRVSHAILAEVNVRRCEHGLEPLLDDAPLAQVAENYSQWMVKTGVMTHNSRSPGREGLRERLEASGTPYRTGAENLAMIGVYAFSPASFYVEGTCVFRDTVSSQIIPRHTYGTMAASFVENWMNSPGHRANILNPKLRRAGAGIAVDPKAEHCGRLYATQLFVG